MTEDARREISAREEAVAQATLTAARIAETRRLQNRSLNQQQKPPDEQPASNGATVSPAPAAAETSREADDKVVEKAASTAPEAEGGADLGKEVVEKSSIGADGNVKQEEAELEAKPAVKHNLKRYTGRIKAFNPVSGFGFIQCHELHKLYDCDIFLNQEVQGGCIVGGTVSFTVEISSSGKPQARDVYLQDTGIKPRVDDNVGVPGQLWRGRVKSFNGGRGFGFITCPPALQHAFEGRDVFVPKNQAPNEFLSVGQEVEFRIVLDKQKQPQARDVSIVARKPGAGFGTMVPMGTDQNAIGWKLF
eukprot:gnl/TRDRNA2_/TRDRNA2_136373_c1_seq1.p1 gnl/TRDRNA2_/TRDRNA2_136373_c1~~gnl/TRDRNA2_/TRDRNA2_136373_c1_seq1.p1  ORF type:complete len:358 (+),score=94.41 gnl/TRDRNA2_/TRDRNA2_136373_c1_seq1:161-1075(+)